ncbi:MAG: transcriptional repressor LexA [Ignavibacteria bacterium]
MKNVLTQRQEDILKFIQKFIQTNGYSPTFREIGKEFGISSTFGVNRHLDALIKKGYLTAGSNMSRSLVPTLINEEKVVVDSDPVVQHLETIVFVPIVARVAIGFPVLAVENIEGNIAVDPSMVQNAQGCFALRIKGDSMINAGIFEGDLVIVSPKKKVRNGEIIIALLGDEVIVRRAAMNGNKIKLIAENPNYEPVSINEPEKFSVIGKVAGVLRWYN